MKKFTFLMGSLLVGLSASAQLYVTGENVENAPKAWDPSQPLEVELVDGTYTFKATDGFKISIQKGTWNDFNGAARMLDGSWDKVPEGTTATATLKAGDANISAPNPGNESLKITYSVSEDLSSITATLPDGSTYPGAGVVTYPDLYLIGPAFGGWTLGENKMTRKDNVYTYVAEDGIDGEWKINNGTWNFSLGQGEAGMPVVGTEYNLADGNAGNLSSTISGKVTIQVTYTEGGPYKLLLTQDGTPVDPDPDPDPDNFAGWYFNLGTPAFEAAGGEWFKGVAVPENGIVEFGEAAIGTDIFKIKIWNTKKDIWYSSTDGTVTPGTPTVLIEEEGEMTVTGATANDIYDVKYDCNTNTLTLTYAGNGGETPDEPEVPATLYLMGNINDIGWCANNGVEMTREGNVYSCESKIEDGLEGYGYFSFSTQLGENADDWGGVNGANRFGPAVSDTEVVVNTALDFTTYVVNVNASSCASWMIAANAADKKYKFIMDFDNSKLTVTEVSGVQTIDSELNGTAIYYNLQGQRVENPVNGIYVRVLNGKAEKIMK